MASKIASEIELLNADKLLDASQQQFEELFENSPNALWEEDFSEAKSIFNPLITSNKKLSGEALLKKHPQSFENSYSKISIKNINQETLSLFEVENKKMFLEQLDTLFSEGFLCFTKQCLIDLIDGHHQGLAYCNVKTAKGKNLAFNIKWVLPKQYANSWKKIFISVQDITEQRNAEFQLKESATQLSAIMDASPDYIWLIDTEFKLLYCNQHSILPEGEKSIGKNFFSFLPENKRNEPRQHILTALKSERRYEYSIAIQKDEREAHYHNVVVPLKSEGKVIGLIINTRDITNQKQMEEQLRQSEKMRAVGQLVGGIAHDFNNMLSGITGATELLRLRNTNFNDKDREYINIIMQASERAAALVAKLLAFGRKGKTTSIVININTIIDDSLSILSRTIDKKIKINIHTHTKNSIVTGDDSALQNMFMNLLINSSHSMPLGGHIYIETENIQFDEKYCLTSPFNIKPGNFIKIKIEDTGTGISKENLQKIFEPYYTTKKRREGMGLGLAAVYGTVQDHHGAIIVESEEGTGTSFHLYLPCSTRKVTQKTLYPKVHTGTGTILLVDDEEFIRNTSKSILKEMGYHILLANDGKEAVEIFKQNHTTIDLVIMDMLMPEMNGKEAFLKMHEIKAQCPIIIASGFMENNDLANLKKSGLSGFLAKPYRSDELSHLVKTTLTPQT